MLSVMIAIAIILAGTVAAVELPPSPTLNVVPAVQQWTPGTGTCEARFQTDLNIAKSEGALILTPEGSDRTKPEGYIIESTAKQVIIRSATPVGLSYGLTTVRQLLRQNPALPQGKIVDWPRYKHRMLMLDVGRKPFPMSVLKDYLRLLAWYKMNELHLHLSDEAFSGKYTGFRIQCDTFPGLASKDLFYTKKELREFQDEAKALGITITPEIDMPGHSRVFTDFWPDIMLKGYPNYMDVTNQKTIERMKKLLDEMIPIFDAPDFHIGTDEYRVGGSTEEKAKLHEAFRRFINTMNAHIRSKGKTTRIWSGFEHMGGTTQIDPTVTIDMWETDDANGQIAKGHHIINSNHGRTYIVPGAHYYGVSNSGIYNSWEPWMVSGDMSKNPAKDNPHLLGGKLHVWNDQGPTGHTMTEIADLVLPSLQAFAEKLWGTKGSKDYVEFQARAARTLPVPAVSVFDRLQATGNNGLIFSLPSERTLTATNTVFPLTKGRVDLECPWTLTMEVFKTAETGMRGVILSSDLAEICADYSRTEEQINRNADGKKIKTRVTRRGIGVIRAAGSRDGADPASSHIAKDVSRVYSDPLILNQWTTITIVGDRRNTSVYVNGAKTGGSDNQTLCPIAQLGSPTGNSFVGRIRNLKVYDRILKADGY